MSKKKGFPFIKFELPKPKKPEDKPPSKPEKGKPSERLTTMMLGEEGGNNG